MTDRPSSSYNRSGGGSCRSGTWGSHSLHRPWLWLASISAGANDPSYPARSVITSRTRIGVPLPGGIWRLMEVRFVTNCKNIISLRRFWRLLAAPGGRERIIPAWAGIDLTKVCTTAALPRFPRSRGDRLDSVCRTCGLARLFRSIARYAVSGDRKRSTRGRAAAPMISAIRDDVSSGRRPGPGPSRSIGLPGSDTGSVRQPGHGRRG